MLTGFGQEVFYKRFTFEYNLPSSVLYNVYSDSRKFIWVTSDAGIARFDGKTFMNFTASEGVPDNEVFDIAEDSLGRIWFTTLRGKVGSIYQGKVRVGTGIEQIDKQYVQDLFFDRNGYLWLGTHNNKLSLVKGSEILYEWTLEKENVNNIIEDENGQIWFTTNKADGILYIENKKIRHLPVMPDTTGKVNNCRPVLLKGNRILFFGPGFWCIIDAGRKKTEEIYLLEGSDYGKIMSGMEDSYGNIWIGTTRGVHLYGKENGTYVEKKRFLENERITGICSDFESNFWLSTLSGGLYYIPCNPLTVSNFQQKDFSNNMSVILESANGTIWFGNDDGNIFKLEDNNLVLAEGSLQEATHVGRVTCGVALHDGVLCFGKDNGLILIEDGKLHSYTYPTAIKSISEDAEGNIWVGTHAFLICLDRKRMIITDTLRVGRVTAAYGEQDKTWFATESGLYTLNNKSPELYLPDSVFGGQRISSIIRSSVSDLLWISTNGKGIFGLSTEDATIKWHITTADGLVSNMCNKVQIDDDGHLWIATKKGINHVAILPDGKKEILLINHDNGIIGDEVNDLRGDKNIIWAATSMGISRFDESAINYLPMPPPVYIEGVSNQNNELPLQYFYEFPYNQSQLKIRLVALSYMSSGKIVYKYKMEGLDSNWTENMSPIINYPPLGPGSYHFVAKAINSRGEESLVPAELYIRVLPAYWQTLWFKLFIGFIVFLIVLSSIVVRVKVIKKREEEKTRLNKMLGELELTALKAQMNPHFIFNSLGSIQNLINRDKKIEANVYLSKFAKLLRMTLDHSDKKVVSLADESSMLELYLGLEALRFVNKFEYRIEIDPGIDAYSVFVPPMILQPFIENAIKHGLLPKKEDALLAIRFAIVEEDILYCMVEDNGIGRVQREKLKEKSSTPTHISKGIKITKNRLELINQLRSKPAEIKITDLYKETGEPSGTRIEIYIPME